HLKCVKALIRTLTCMRPVNIVVISRRCTRVARLRPREKPRKAKKHSNVRRTLVCRGPVTASLFSAGRTPRHDKLKVRRTFFHMKIEGKHQIRAPRERVYEALVDPVVLQRIIPGCEELEKTGDNIFAATMRTGVGSIKGVFNGNVRLEDLRPPEHFRMVVDGKGAPGFLKGSGDLDLQTE